MECYRKKHVDGCESNPENDIYKCRCGKLYKASNPIIGAIKELAVERVKRLIKESDGNIPSTNGHTMTLFQFIHSCFYYRGGLTPIDRLDNYSVKNHKPAEEVDKLLEIVRIICATFPEQITDSEIKMARAYGSNKLIKIFGQYYINTGDELCYICSSSHSTLIDSPCGKCKIKVHIECICELAKKYKNCNICRTSFRSTHDSRNRIIFPYANIYWAPLMSYWTIPETKEEQLDYAIINLQIDRVKNLLGQFTPKEVVEFLGGKRMCTYFRKSPNLLCDNFPSNWFRNSYPMEYAIIEMFLEKKINQLNLPDLKT